jgi:hypothetical protein
MLSYGFENDGTLITGNYHRYVELASDGLWTTPADFSKFIIETQLSLSGKANHVLNIDWTKAELNEYSTSSNASLGTFVIRKGERNYLHHVGVGEGFGGIYYGSLDGSGDGVVVVANSENTDLLTEIVNSVARSYGWKDFYQPKVKKIARLTSQWLANLEGKYVCQLSKGEDNYIEIQKLWDNASIVYYPESDLEFFNLNIDFPLVFRKNKYGVVDEIIGNSKDVWKKINK